MGRRAIPWGLRIWFGRQQGDLFYCVMPGCHSTAGMDAERFVQHMNAIHQVQITDRDFQSVHQAR